MIMLINKKFGFICPFFLKYLWNRINWVKFIKNDGLSWAQIKSVKTESQHSGHVKGKPTFCIGKLLKGLTVLVIPFVVVIHLDAYP
jgi:hypothetical protein